MAEPREIKRRVKAAVLPAVFLAVTALMGWNIITGYHGLNAYPERQELLRQVTQENDAARAERDTWARRVAGMRARTLDPDTLDERARAMLNRVKPDDVIVQYPPKEKLF